MDASETNKLWRPRWYYILRNKTSGKLYAGQTVQDIKNYLGSGVYWGKHCLAYGGYTRSNIETVEEVWIEQRVDAQAWLDALEAREPGYWNGGSGKRWANQGRETTEDSSLLGQVVWVHKETGATRMYPKGERPGCLWEKCGISGGKISGKRFAELGIGIFAPKHFGKGGKRLAELGLGCHALEHRGKGGKKTAELGIGIFSPGAQSNGGRLSTALRWPMTYLALELGCPKTGKKGPFSAAHIEQWLATSPRAEEFRARWAVMEAEIRSKF